MQRPWGGQSNRRRDQLWDCSNLNAVEELERKEMERMSTAVTGSGDSAPSRLLAMSKAQLGEIHNLRFNWHT
jgi:hypothetical protein